MNRHLTAALIITVAATSFSLLSPIGAASAKGSCSVSELSPVTYQAFDGHTETLTPWEGSTVAVLVEPGPVRDPAVMTKMVCAFQRAWKYYKHTTGRTPPAGSSLDGRDVVAEVSTTCGAGCSYIGATGTEIQTTYFEDDVYGELAQSNLYDQVPFYEFGRNFWFWSDQLDYSSPCTSDAVITGFAVWMRFRSMSAAHVKGAPFNGTPFKTFSSQVAGLEGVYDDTTSDTFAGTLCTDTSPGMYGGTDFWASIMMKLASLYGDQAFVSRFWHYMGSLPAATTTGGAVANWLKAANHASCVNLKSVFYKRWGFPKPDGSVVDPRPPASSVPFPSGHC